MYVIVAVVSVSHELNMKRMLFGSELNSPPKYDQFRCPLWSEVFSHCPTSPTLSTHFHCRNSDVVV